MPKNANFKSVFRLTVVDDYTKAKRVQVRSLKIGDKFTTYDDAELSGETLTAVSKPWRKDGTWGITFEG